MKCEEVETRLDDYVDGSLTEAEFQEVEHHVHECASCRGQERLLRALLAQAAAIPREMRPTRDLWPGIAQRVGRRNALSFPPPGRDRLAGKGWALAAAAALLTATAVLLMRRDVERPGPGLAQAPTAAVARPAALAPDASGILEAERDYARAAATLMAALDAQRDTLSPETLAAVERNLQVIDEALKQIRDALEKEPGNARLARMLSTTHRKKVDVLRRVTKLARI